MANEFAKKIQDAELIETGALPEADGTSYTSADFDMGAGSYKPDLCELELSIPELSATNLPSADTLTITVVGGSSASPTTTLNLEKVVTGTGSTIAAQTVRFRLGSDCPRYVRVKMVAAGGTGDMSAKTLTAKLLF